MPKLTKQLVDQNFQQRREGGAVVINNHQVSSFEDISTLLQGRINFVHLDLSFNMIRAISPDVQQLRSLLFLDLSTNLITKIEGIEQLGNLQVLRLSRNRIQKIENLQHNTNLNALDLSMNQISRIENLQELGQLKILYLYGNNIIELDGLNHLKRLRELRIEQNQIKDIVHLSTFQSQLEHLDAHTNKIDNLDDTIVTLSHLPKLEHLTLYNNPIANDATYRYRIIDYRNIKKLDGLLIQDYIHDVLSDMAENYTLEELVVKTQTAFRDLAKQEAEIKDTAVNLLKRQINQLERDYIEFQRGIEDEMEDLNAFVAVLRNKKSLGEEVVQDRQKLEVWKQKVSKLEHERRETIRQRMIALEHERQEYLNDARSKLDFTGKLYEISQHNPKLWRDIKEKEWRERVAQETEKAQREGFLDQLIEEEEDQQDTHMPIEKQMEMSRQGLLKISENQGGQLSNDTQARLDLTRNQAASTIQRNVKNKKGSKACVVF